MKSDRHLPKLPSIRELLDHPTVQGVVQRVNETTIAQRATGLLAELQATLWERTEQVAVPSIGQLAQRLADRLLGRREQTTPVINATGVVCGASWPAPLADAAIHELMRIGPEFYESNEAMIARVDKALTELTGAEAAWVVSSYAAAATLARECADGHVDFAQHAGLYNPAEFRLTDVATIADRIRAGATLVVADGAGLLGGPCCGILVGERALVDKLQQHALASALAVDALALIALEATLGIYRSEQRVIHQIPVLQLLSAPLENLKQRSERLAQLLAANDRIAEAEPVRCESTWCDLGTAKLDGPSWAILVRATGDGNEALAKRLTEAMPQIVARPQQDGVWFDLRSVFPRWDRQLVRAMEDSPAGG